ncbi:flavodoxin family protein [Anaeroselena agilis]|uniref:Flavodoxin family protein n=1 Tax=Anaeroselena agilis TaxID=3063788 RepID=A0ABU3NWB2_9FIRM|nr:flavodoxin family protein [Selenomonadales bacterium 4137-cl]
MKVIAFNGSPRKEGNTYYAMSLVGEELLREGIGFEVVQVGDQCVRGCMACKRCIVNQNERCVICSDDVNDWIQRMKRADGVLLGSPTYYGGVAGPMKCFLDRAFYVIGANQSLTLLMWYKVWAAVAAMGRAGGVAVYDNLSRYFSGYKWVCPMPTGFPVIFGDEPGDAKKDARGIQVMRILGKSMACLLKEVSAAVEGRPG